MDREKGRTSDQLLAICLTMQRFRALPLLTVLTLALLCGCQSANRHSFISHVGPAETLGNLSSDSGRQDERVLFNSVNASNQIRPEWLVSPTNFFRLGPGDTIEIEALGEPGPPSAALVGPDGKIYYGLLGGIFVWGLTLTDAKELLEKDLAKYVRVKPEVALTLKSVASKRVWVLGGVQKPGVYSLATPVTLLEAISAAGGIGAATAATTPPISSAETTDLENSFVIREGKLMPIDFSKLLRHGDLSQNIYLQADDFVYLRPLLSKGDIYVLGAVAVPNIIEYREHISLVAAIASSGGPVPYAYASHVAIVRGSLIHPTIATFDYDKIVKGKGLDATLEPGDIVYVPYSPFRFVEQLADQILTQFVSTVAINAGQRAVLGPNAPVVGVTVPFAGGGK